MLLHLANDLRYAARRLAASPGFTVATVATIAIGVGVNTGIFSVLNGLALRDLPVPDSGELVGIAQTIEGVERTAYGSSSMFSTAEYRTYRDSSTTLAGLVGFSTSVRATLGGEVPQRIGGALVTCNYFEVLREPLLLGPGFRADDCEAAGNATPTVVLGHGLWTTVFGADRAIVGRKVLLNRQSFTVVGVAEEGMRGFDLEAASYFAPIAAQPLLQTGFELYGNDEASWLTLLGRRAPGTTLGQVRAELGVIAARIDQQQASRETTLIVESGRPVARPEARPLFVAATTVVMAAFGMVLLVACANVANLLLARATARSSEIAVRMSLGASRGRIVQQLLAESALIAALGGALGSVLAVWSFQGLVTFVLSAFGPETPQLTLDLTPDARVLAYAFVLTLVTGVLFGLLPALRASSRELNTVMKGASASGHRSEGRLRGALVATQVAVCMMLVIGASLLLRGLYATQTVEPGFRYENVTVVAVSLDGGEYDGVRAAEFRRQLVERVAGLPGVEAIAQALRSPLSEGTVQMMAGLPGQEQLFPMDLNYVSADYFSLLELPLALGRAFSAADETDTPAAAIVTEATARRLWPDRNSIGERLVVETGANVRSEVEIVGITRDAEVRVIGETPSRYLYLPAPSSLRRELLVKGGDFAALAPQIRAAVGELDPAVVMRVAPLEANLDFWRRLAGVISTLATGLGVVALVLAVVGVYGVVAYAVGRRTREIGIRVALGAATRDVVALVLEQTMRPVIVGVAIGVAGGLAVSRVLSSVLFGVSPTDVIALLGAALVVVGAALAAGILPARRASRVDANVVLHYE
ncbi:MAG: ABC transporter permease [Lysobacterales bacterium]|nr:MAG: ABC transporter permease [Xanthomonadales bacterium]